MFFLENVFFLGLGDGENCSPKIFEKFEVFRGGGGFYSLFSLTTFTYLHLNIKYRQKQLN